MGFKSVYKCLQEIFPKVDSRLLRAVAIENSKDADQAVDVVLKEIIPYLSSQFGGPVNPHEDFFTSVSPPEDNEVESEDQVVLLRQQQRIVDKADVGPSSELRSISSDDAKVTEDIGGALHVDSTPLVEVQNDSMDLDFYDANDGNDQSCGNTENEEVILIGMTHENSAKVGLNEMVHVTSSALLDEGNNDQKQCCENTESDELITWGAWKENNIKAGSEQTYPGMTTALINEKDGVRGFDSPVADDLDMVICLKSDKEESCLDSTKAQASSGSADVTSKQDYFVGEMSDIEDEPTIGTVVTRSGQVCNLDLLEEIIEDAKNNKHAGEVYGEKSILATEVRELQSRILSLADERDKSLAILNEMHQSLEARLSIAEEMRKAAEQERLDKEKSARKALAEQNAIMEKVLQESKILKEEAEENSKLREFLIDRGHIVDMLQGEISVICQDVSLLKEKFDDRVPLSKSVSSSQTSCILAASGTSVKSMVSGLVPEGTLASSGSSVKSMASDMVSEHSLASSGSSLKSEAPVLVTKQGKSSETPKRTSPTPSVDSLSPRNRPEEEGTKADHQALLDDGWDFFDKDAEFDI
ncbi:hypothetical protein RGQ29_007984 [Quercus rubra]|nr:hypothetical protein RGQ29_007984 [Quercus rubra]